MGELIDIFVSGLLGKDGIIVFFAATINLVAIVAVVGVCIASMLKLVK